MAARLGSMLQHLKLLAGGPETGDALDRQLLIQFAQDHDEAAFAALVRRHGPMVLGVSRRVLGDASAADDVFQATFLVLVRKAAVLQLRGSLAGWLYTVASRIAFKAKKRATLQQAHERQAPAASSADDLHWRELRTVLDEELNRLPARCRLPLVLCYLQGLTRDEAAEQLEWSLSTLKRRLDEGRELLRQRLQRRGMGLSGALLASALAGSAASAAPAELMMTTVRAALGFAAGEQTAIPAGALALAEGALHTMGTIKLKIAVAVLLLLGALGVGSGVLLHPVLAGNSGEQARPIDSSESAAQQPARAVAPAAPVHKGLALHEWGVWRVHNDLELAGADMRAVWDGLPKFVYGQVSARDLPKHWSQLNVDRPIIFFHAAEPVEVNLRVDFTGGLPAVWWPATVAPAFRDGRLMARRQLLNGQTPADDTRPFRALQWKLRIKAPPVAERAEGKPPVDDGHWVKTLRAVKADDVFAQVGEEGFGYERERFVYYDGMLPRSKWVTIQFDKDKMSVANQAKHPVFDLTVVDGKAERVRVARLAKLEAGAAATELRFDTMDLQRWPYAGVATLTKQLQDAGLNEDEAGSLVELWRQDLFLTDGITLFYRLPQDEYDRQLPLTVTPRPERVVRVGLAVHPHVEPDLKERVDALVKDMDSDRFAVRQQATTRLEAMGRAAFVHLARIRKQGWYDDGQKQVQLSLELRRRIEMLLEKHDAQGAVKK
jgi:RNA polymerase sigma factor (sigma-70 family)